MAFKHPVEDLPKEVQTTLAEITESIRELFMNSDFSQAIKEPVQKPVLIFSLKPGQNFRYDHDSRVAAIGRTKSGYYYFVTRKTGKN